VLEEVLSGQWPEETRSAIFEGPKGLMEVGSLPTGCMILVPIYSDMTQREYEDLWDAIIAPAMAGQYRGRHRRRHRPDQYEQRLAVPAPGGLACRADRLPLRSDVPGDL
jgi:hypothetical protein